MAFESYIPLTETTFFILVSLARGPQYGYAIRKETAVLSDGRVKMSTSTLYGAIKRLRDLGWITRSSSESKVESGRERKAYQLTDMCRQILNAECARIKSLAALTRNAEMGISP